MHLGHLLLLPHVSRIRLSTTGRQTLKKQIASCSHENKIPVLFKNDSQKAKLPLKNGPFIFQLIGQSEHRLHHSLSRMVTKNQMCFLDWKAETEENIHHMGFTFYIAVELSPWLSFLSCEITIFSVGVTACYSDFSETPPRIKHIENGTSTPSGFFLSHSSLILFRLLYHTWLLSFSVHQPDCRLGQREVEDHLILLGNMAPACIFLSC